jgi:hypothetical protein
MSDHDEAMRILGARDGYIGALLKVRQQISNLGSVTPIDARHVRKAAAHEAKIAPLRALERLFDEQQKACGAAYKALMDCCDGAPNRMEVSP